MVPAVLLAYSGLAAVCFAMNRHHRQLWHRPATARRSGVLRLVGACLLVASLLVATTVAGVPRGIVVWFGIAPLAALLLIVLLPFSPRTAGVLALLAPVSALLLL